MSRLFKMVGTLPFLMAVFLNTLVDLGHKIVIQNTIFKVYDGNEQVFLTAIVNGLILLPFILLFSTAGFLADKYPKSSVMRLAAWFAVALTIGITMCYAFGWFWAAFAMTFLLAVQSAIYSPAKYGYIKALFGKQHLAEGNGLVQAISIIGILAGTVLFSILFELWFPKVGASKSDILSTLIPVGFLLIISSVFELVMMYRIPQLDEPNDAYTFDWKAYRTGKMALSNLKPVLNNQVIYLSIIGLTVFWSIAQVLLAAFPAFVKNQTGETNTIIIQAILGASGIGIALGSLIAAKSSKNYIETGLVPIGAAGVAIGLLVLPMLSNQWLMGLDFLFIGMMGGLFIVPLNSLIQYHASEKALGRVLAANNLIQNIGMLLFLVVTVVFAVMGLSSASLLLLIAVVAVLGFAYTVYHLPQSLVKFVLSYLMGLKYKVNVAGMKNIPATGGVLLLGNHISWIDWAVVQLASPRRVRFVMLKSIYERWYLSWFFKLFGSIPIEAGPSSQKALEQVAELLNDGAVVCLFPEGTISRNGHLGHFKHGYRKAAKLANDDVVIVPFYLQGLWGSQFSRSSDKLKSATNNTQRRQLLVSFGSRLPIETETEVLKRRIFDLSITAWESYKQSLPTLAEAWIESAKRVGSDMAIADTAARPLSATDALVSSIQFSRHINRTSTAQNIGILLPTSRAAVLANLAGLLSGKTLVNLHPQNNAAALNEMIKTAEVEVVYTSAALLKTLLGDDVDLVESLSGVAIVDIDYLTNNVKTPMAVATWLIIKCLPVWLLKKIYNKQHDAKSAAAIVFTEGEQPKAVVL
ncbi:MAG: MFS transporter, partial [Leucothrix sp.]